jgi:hypothetical protein
MNIHQELSVNTLGTTFEKFSAEFYLEGLVLLNQKLLSVNNGELSTPTIITNQHILSNRTRVDLLLKYENLVGVVELKNIELTNESFKQINKYLSFKEEILQSKEVLYVFDENEKSTPEGIFGVLCGNSIDEATLIKIQEHNKKHDSIKIFVVLIKKYRTDNDQFFITSNCINFKEDLLKSKKSNAKDFTKYSYENQVYGKGRLVLAVINDYVSNNNIISTNKLKEIFKDALQGSTLGCFKDFNLIENKNMVRYFSNENNIIKVGNHKIAVCNQWGKGNIEKFITYCNTKLKLKITSIS